MAAKPFIKYKVLSEPEYSQQTLGANSGTQIETEQIKLVPFLLERDAPLLWEIAKNSTHLFRLMTFGPLETYEAFYKAKAKFCTLTDWSNWVCYVSAPTVDGNKNWVICGHVALVDISLLHRHFEVGGVWLHPSVHGTFVVVETTYALLRFSYEKLQAGRVVWKTHHRNMASQKAAVKLGFQFEGIHRKHMVDSDGLWRNTYWYGMTDDEWFGREQETEDARRGLDVVAAAAALLDQGEVESKQQQKQLEELIANRKKSGKPLPSSIDGKPLFD
ncbi:hypothetical protein BGZ99_008970 [Dissophora globulifera]|uniref:N-acetyltransferase domain-containing protein n=1 Tax=Dissophora globulifera TaxID=979702 RepID=A0A9P6R646_9FUNG|nr:hypothetical protein BGZ99_008970 [Dissophora globulifera]